MNQNERKESMKSPRGLGRFLDLMRKLRFYEILLLIFILLVIGVWSVFEITQSSVFCGNTCHIMRPHYNDWKTSSHNQVSCVECHNPTGDDDQFASRWSALAQVASYFTRTYGEWTRAEVSDTGCLKDGCHSKRLLDGQVTFQGNILFDHRPHLQQLRRGKILRCSTCHSQVAMGDHITVVEDACFICHFKQGAGYSTTARCTLCHGSLEDPSGAMDARFDHTDYLERGVNCERCHSSIISGDGKIEEDKCLSCHSLPVKLVLSEPVEILHRKHVTDHSVECDDCHEPIRHTIVRELTTAGFDCSSCHDNRHSGILLLYQGKGVNNITPTPSPMFLAQVGCRGCHIVPQQPPDETLELTGQTMKAVSTACDSCHGDGYNQVLGTWKKDTESAVRTTGALLAEAEKALASSPPENPTIIEAGRLLKEGRHNFLFVRASVPIHNTDYALAILDKTVKDLKKVITLTRQVNDGVQESQPN
ncbi:MAG: hypothetical protein EP302_10695 [Bacteroidetes bacterium]|nr:MAG: hypothetical protein EP302_10695 [Bacteroidota bacterium]